MVLSLQLCVVQVARHHARHVIAVDVQRTAIYKAKRKSYVACFSLGFIGVYGSTEHASTHNLCMIHSHPTPYARLRTQPKLAAPTVLVWYIILNEHVESTRLQKCLFRGVNLRCC
jgi:hypothetical protein